MSRKSKRQGPGPMRRLIVGVLVAAGVWLALVQLQGVLPGLIGPYQFRILMLSGIAIILAVSLNLINGFAGQFSLGHAGFYAIGAYWSAYLTYYFGPAITGLFVRIGLPPDLASAALLLTAVIAGAIAASVAGLIVGLPSLRLRGDYLAIATLGFGEAIVVIIQNTNAVGAQRGFNGVPIYTDFAWIFAAVILVILFSRNLATSAQGRALFAIRDDEIAAQASGVNVFRYKLLVFAVSAAWAGVAGALFAHFEGYLSPKSFGFMKSVDIVIMVVLGGGGSISGSALAAVALTTLPEALRDMTIMGRDFQQYRMVVYAALLIILMLTRPQGLFGRSELSFRDLSKWIVSTRIGSIRRKYRSPGND